MNRIVAAFIIVILPSFALGQGPTQTFAPGTVLQANMYRFGSNVGGTTYYGSGEILKNMACLNNCGMEPVLGQQTFVVNTTGTTTSMTGPNQFQLGAGIGGQDGCNIWAGATVRTNNSQSGGTTGYSGTVSSNAGSVSVTSGSVVGTTLTAITSQNPIACGMSSGDTINVENISGGSGITTGFACCTISAITSTSISWVQASGTPSGTFSGGTIGNNLVKTYNVTPAATSAFSNGDTMIFTKLQSPTPLAVWTSGTPNLQVSISGGATVFGATTGGGYTLCATCGSQSFGVSVASSGDSGAPFIYMDNGGTPQRFTNLNGTYAYSYWAQLASGSLPKATVSIGRVGQTQCTSTTTSITGTYAQITGTCTFAETSATANTNLSMSVTSSWNGAANTVLLDNFDFHKTSGLDATNTTSYRDEYVAAMRNFYGTSSGSTAPCLDRNWTTQNAETFDSWTKDAYNAPQAGLTLANGDGAIRLYDRAQYDEMMGCDPYIELPVTLTQADAALIVEFFLGSSGTTGGARRAALGHPSPYAFGKIFLTYCNECWNGSFTYQNLPNRSGVPNCSIPSTNPMIYYDYGKNAGLVYTAMRADPAFNSSVIQLGFDAQTANIASLPCAIQDGKPDFVELNDYHYSVVTDMSSDAAALTPGMIEPYLRATSSADPSHFHSSATTIQGLNLCGSSGTAACYVTTYETGNGSWGTCPNGGSGACAGTNPTTPPYAITQTQDDILTEGSWQAVPEVLAHLLNCQMLNVCIENDFASTEYSNGGISSFKILLWGCSAVDYGGAMSFFNGVQYTPRPCGLGVEVMNRAIIGPMISCPMTGISAPNWTGTPYNGVPNSSYSSTGGVPAVSSVPVTYSFCFKNGTKIGVVYVNTDISGTTTNVAFSGANAPTGTVSYSRWNPSNPDALCEAHLGSSNNSVTSCALTTSTASNPTSIALPFGVTSIVYDTGAPASNGISITGGLTMTGGAKIQ